jgi:hypothetical protein
MKTAGKIADGTTVLFRFSPPSKAHHVPACSEIDNRGLSFAIGFKSVHPFVKKLIRPKK